MRTPTLRDKIEPSGGEVDPKALMDAWVYCKLTPEDELKTMLEHVYYSHADPEYREACEFIKDAAKLLKKKERKK